MSVNSQVVSQLNPGLSSELDRLVGLVNQLSFDEYHRLMKRLQRSNPSNGKLADAQEARQGKKSSIELTKRESEVLTLVASGYSRKEIGLALAISENTAACHIASIYRKLDISTIAEATKIAVQWGAV